VGGVPTPPCAKYSPLRCGPRVPFAVARARGRNRLGTRGVARQAVREQLGHGGVGRRERLAVGEQQLHGGGIAGVVEESSEVDAEDGSGADSSAGGGLGGERGSAKRVVLVPSGWLRESDGLGRPEARECNGDLAAVPRVGCEGQGRTDAEPVL
jgi:hypothetical protein